MELPKIKNEELPERLKEILGVEDAVFDSIVDPMDVIDNLGVDPESYYKQRYDIQQKLMASNRKLNEYKKSI
jgi:hypothetical protein